MPPPHKYIVKNVLFDDEEEFTDIYTKYDDEGRPKMLADYKREQRQKMLEQRNRKLLERQEQVQNSALESTRNALELLRESEDIGITMGDELARQGESLRKVNNHLDTMNAGLETSERQLGGIESAFYNLRNRITGRSKRLRKKKQDPEPEVRAKSRKNSIDSHPSTRLHQHVHTRQDTVETKIEENLEEMVNQVVKLKCIGLELGNEIDEQNKLLDDLVLKVDNAEVKVDGQTKRIRKILKK